MLRYLRQNTIAFIALTLSIFTLGGATAYAVNTVRSSDIVDGQVMQQDLAPNSVGNGKIIDGQVMNHDLANNSVGSTKIIDNSVTGNDVNEATLGRVPDAGKLAGHLPATFRQNSYSAEAATSDCVLAIQTWYGCAPVAITVPAGRIWKVTVVSSVDAAYSSTSTNALCSATEGPSCIDSTPQLVTFWGGGFTSASTSATAFLFSGAHTLSTAVKVGALPSASPNALVTTTVLIHDYDAESLGS